MAANNKGGYIGRSPEDSSVIIARQSYEPTGVTTDFTFNSGYDVGFIDCYLNGVRLIEGKDYTAGNGSTVGLTTATLSGDVVELVAYKAFNATSVTDATGNFSVGSKLTVSGISTLGDVVSSGIVTADKFYGDGSNLSGLPGQADFWIKTAAGINTTVAVGVGTTRPDSIARVNNSTILNAGIVTAYQFYGDGSNLSGVGVVGVNTAGFSTFKEIAVSGVSTFKEDVEFQGANSGVTSVTWDKSANSLIFKDDAKVILGTGSDLNVYHTGGNNYVSGTPNLYVQSNGAVALRSVGQENMVVATANGSVALYHDNTKKAETAANGIDITGHVETDTLKNTGVTTSAGVQVSAGSTIFVGDSKGSLGNREGAHVRQHSVGLGTTTTAGKLAGVGTDAGTLVFDVTLGEVQVYSGTSTGWVKIVDAFSASGGTKNTTGRSNWAVHTFTGSGSFVVAGGNRTGEYLVIGAGGGGGTGGGGAGGMLNSTSFPITPGTYTITVGGAGGGSGPGGTYGAPSHIQKTGISSITAEGGGGGNGPNFGSRTQGQHNGGSGGGGVRDGQTPIYGQGNRVAGTESPAPTQGNNGGPTPGPAGNTGAPGGGGAGGAGTAGSGGSGPTEQGGNGGQGSANSITGSSVTYAGGGGGACEGAANSPDPVPSPEPANNQNGSLPGPGGGGAGGAARYRASTAGTDNKGGGGGGSGPGFHMPGQASKPGGSGVVIVAYPTA